MAMLMHTKGIDKEEDIGRAYEFLDGGHHTILTRIRDPYTSQNLEQLRRELWRKYRKEKPALAIALDCIGQMGEEGTDKDVLSYSVMVYKLKPHK